jgi:hypothetical protein
MGATHSPPLPGHPACTVSHADLQHQHQLAEELRVDGAFQGGTCQQPPESPKAPQCGRPAGLAHTGAGKKAIPKVHGTFPKVHGTFPKVHGTFATSPEPNPVRVWVKTAKKIKNSATQFSKQDSGGNANERVGLWQAEPAVVLYLKWSAMTKVVSYDQSGQL